MNKLHKSLNKLENKDDITGRKLMKILCKDGLNYLPQVDNSFKELDEDIYSISYISEDPVKDMLFGYYQIGKNSEKSKSDIRQDIRSSKSGFKPLFTIITECKEKNSEKSKLDLKIQKDIELVRRQESIGDNPPITQYFQLHTDNIEPVYYDLLSKMRFSSTDEISDVRERVSKQFEKDTITSEFYDDFRSVLYDKLIPSITVSENKININRKKHAQVIINRLLFLLFIQEKGWLDNNNNYLQDKYKELNNRNNLYQEFYKDLFFNALCNTSKDTSKIGDIPYFNSGLFEPRKFIDDNKNEEYLESNILEIDNEFFVALFGEEGILNRYKITIDEENPSEKKLAVDPEFVGQVFETFMNNKEREEKGTFYTPRPMTRTIVKNSLFRYLERKTDIQNISDFIVSHNEDTLDNYEPDDLKSLLTSIQIVDPAVGSGAFIIEMIDELNDILSVLGNDKRSDFERKKHIATEILYGVDIDSQGIELTKFRVWLNMVKNKDDFTDSDVLPNLDSNFVKGNTLCGEFSPINNAEKIVNNYNNQDYSKIKKDFVESSSKEKDKLKKKMNKLRPDIGEYEDPMKEVRKKSNSTFIWNKNFPEVFSKGGFDIVVGNPPYVGGSDQEYIKPLSNVYEKNYNFYEKIPGMRYDLYQKFIIRGWEILSDDGVMSYITSDTFRTIGSKISSRNVLLNNNLQDIILTTDNTFDATVQPCIFTIGKWDKNKNRTRYVNAKDLEVKDYPSIVSTNVSDSKNYSCNINNNSYTIGYKELDDYGVDFYILDQDILENSISKSLFEPTRRNINIVENVIQESKSLIKNYKDSILDSKKAKKNKQKVRKEHINNLDPGDVTVFGLVTEGGQGLSTGDNEEYIAYLENSDRGQKLIDKLDNDYKYVEKNNKSYYSISRIINDKHIYNFETKDARDLISGIDSSSNTWVRIIKGKRKSYYAPPRYYIKWSKEDVKSIISDGVVRNKDKYFDQGIFISRGGSGDSVIRYANNSVFDSSGGFYTARTNKISAKYLNGVMNSSLIKDIINNFINSTVNTQITDIRKVPIFVPSDSERKSIEGLVDKAIEARKNENPDKVDDISEKINEEVLKIYGFL